MFQLNRVTDAEAKGSGAASDGLLAQASEASEGQVA